MDRAELYKSLQAIFGEAYQETDYQRQIASWERKSRFFHNLNHLFNMTSYDPRLSNTGTINIAKIVTLAGLFHDTEYPTIKEEIDPEAKKVLEQYIDLDTKKLKPLVTSSNVDIARRLFGFAEGQELSPFGGMNEFYSTIIAINEMERFGIDQKTIIGVITAIEATCPFKAEDRLQVLKVRLDKANVHPHLNVDLSADEIDQIIYAAAYVANKDIQGFIGTLDPQSDIEPTLEAVLISIYKGNLLSQEEVPELRDKQKGDYPVWNHLQSAMKRAGLYNLVIKFDDTAGRIPNLFHGYKDYPDAAYMKNAGELSYKVNVPASIAENARLLETALTYSIAAVARIDPRTANLKQFISETPLNKTTPAVNSTPHDELAMQALQQRYPVDYDYSSSPLAAEILARVGGTKVIELGKKARSNFLNDKGQPKEFNPAELRSFVDEMQTELGDFVDIMKSEMARVSAISDKHSDAAKLAALNFNEHSH